MTCSPSLLPPGLHPSALPEPALPQGPKRSLCAAVRGRGEHRDRRVPEPSRGHPGPDRRAPHLDPDLEHHPHIHCIATGGGLSQDGKRWISSRPNFFLPVRKLSKVFRGKLLEAFELALREGRLRTREAAGRLLLRRAAAQDFVVYSKPPMAGPEQVLRYLGRYTHRIAISNERLLAHRDGEVTFSYKDRKNGGRRKTMTLPGPSSHAASCSTSSPDASCGCATTASSPTASRPADCSGRAACSAPPRHPSRPRPSPSPGKTPIAVSWERTRCSAPLAASAGSSWWPTSPAHRSRRTTRLLPGRREPFRSALASEARRRSTLNVSPSGPRHASAIPVPASHDQIPPSSPTPPSLGLPHRAQVAASGADRLAYNPHTAKIRGLVQLGCSRSRSTSLASSTTSRSRLREQPCTFGRLSVGARRVARLWYYG